MLAEARLEGINESVVAQGSHAVREEDPAEDQAEAEKEPALRPGCDVGFEGALGGAEQIAAVDPRGGHGEQGDPLGQGTPRDDEVGGGAVLHLAARRPTARKAARMKRKTVSAKLDSISKRAGALDAGIETPIDATRTARYS